MKDGDKVWFKTKEDKLVQGVLKGKTVTSGKKKYRPPMNNIYKSLEGARKSQWRPRTYAKKEWEELGAAPRKAKKRVKKVLGKASATKKKTQPKKSLPRLKKMDEDDGIFNVMFEGVKYQVNPDREVISYEDYGEVGKWNEKTGRIDFTESFYRNKLRKMSSPELRKIAKESTVPFEKKHAKDILKARDMMMKMDPNLDFDNG